MRISTLLFLIACPFFITSVFAQPIVERIEPSSGCVGTVLDLKGRNFDQITDLSFPTQTGTLALSFYRVDAQTVRLAVPRGAISGPLLINQAFTDSSFRVTTESTFLQLNSCISQQGLTRVRLLGGWRSNMAINAFAGGNACLSNRKHMLWPSPYYSDTIMPRETFTLEITTNTTGGISVWVDWNRNGQVNADPGEWQAFPTVQQPGTFTLPLTVPKGMDGGFVTVIVAQNSQSTTPLAQNQLTSLGQNGSMWTFKLRVYNPYPGPDYCFTNLQTTCSNPAYIDSVLVPDAGYFDKATACNEGYSLALPYAGAGSRLVTLQEGRTYPIAIRKGGTANAICRAWLDLDRDGEFETSELVYENLLMNGTPSLSQIVVPLGVAVGTGYTRMRVRMAYPAATQLNACDALTNAQTVDYFVRLTQGCPDKPVITSNSGNGLCIGTSKILSVVTGGNQVRWNTGQTTASITIFTPRVYRVVLNNGVCDSDSSDPFIVSIEQAPPAPAITVSDTSLCQGDSALLTGPAGYAQYTWSSGDAVRQIWVKRVGSYSLRVSNGNCVSPSSAAIRISFSAQPPQPVIVGNSGFCPGDSTRLSGPPGYSYLWNSGETTSSIWVSNTRIVTLRIGRNGCFSVPSAPVAVTVLPTPAAPTIQIVGSTRLCWGKSVELVSPRAGQYYWSTGATARQITVRTSGTITLRIIDTLGCSSPASAPVTISVLALPKPPVVQASGQLRFCEGESVRLFTPSTLSGYKWSTGETTASITVSASGRYSLQAVNADGCASDTGFYQAGSGLYAYPVGASAEDSVHLLVRPELTCPLPSSNPQQSLSGAATLRLHSGVTLSNQAWQNVVSTTDAGTEPTTRLAAWPGGWFAKSLNIQAYYGLTSAQLPSQLCAVLNGGNPVGGWFEREGKRLEGITCTDFFIPLPIPVSPAPNPFALEVEVLPRPVVSITQQPDTLVANPPGMAYQWLRNGQPITGATNRKLPVTVSGNYQVVASRTNGCADTSAVTTATATSITQRARNSIAYPNPSAGHLYLNTPDKPNAQLFDGLVRRMPLPAPERAHGQAWRYSLRHLPDGIYYLHLDGRVQAIILRRDR